MRDVAAQVWVISAQTPEMSFFRADTFDEIAEMSKKHGMEMFQKADEKHIEAMTEMKKLMSDEGAMEKWMKDRRREFDALPECQ